MSRPRKNSAYMVWCFLVVLVNYSVVAHWTWNEESWLHQLGFMDSSGAAAVHITGAVCGLVAVAFLGMRQDVMDYETGELKQQTASPRPVLVAMGTMLLWYGWFAFHLASPIVAKHDAGGRLGTIVLSTCVAPAAAALSAYLIIEKYYKMQLKFESLVSCVLAGLVSITASNMTMGVWQSYAIGFFASPVFFAARKLQRAVLLDDPLDIGPIHLWPAVYSIVMEGVFADGKMHHRGLIHGGFGHFGVQLLGAVSILAFNGVTAVALYQIILQRVFFRGRDMRVSMLDNYLGTNLFEVNSKEAFETLVKCRAFRTRKLLYDFHRFTDMSYVSELLDFAVAVNEFKKLCADMLYEDAPVYESDTGNQQLAAVAARPKKPAEKLKAAFSSRLSKLSPNSLDTRHRSSLFSMISKKKRNSKESSTMLDKFRVLTTNDSKKAGRFDPAIAFFKAKAVIDSRGRIEASFWQKLPLRSEASVQEKMVQSCIEAIIEQFVADIAPQSVNLPYGIRKECMDALTQSKAMDRVLTDALIFERVAAEAKRMLSPAFYKFLVVVNPESKPEEIERVLASLPSNSNEPKTFDTTVSNDYANARVPYVIDAKWRVRWDESLLCPHISAKALLSNFKGVLHKSGKMERWCDPSTETVIADGKRAGPFVLEEIVATALIGDEAIQIQMPAHRSMRSKALSTVL